MTSGVPAPWQTFRLGLRSFSPGRATLSTLQRAIGTPKRSERLLRHSNNGCGLLHRSWGRLFSFSCSRPTWTIRPVNRGIGKQSRWVSLWRRTTEKEKAQEETAADQEISISPAEVAKIFGRKMNTEEGFEILVTLQQHRLEGTLDHAMPYSDTMIARGLAWLRKKNPADEDAAIIARIDRESPQTRTPQTNVKHSRQAVSQFERMREENKRKNNEEEERRKVEEKEEMGKRGLETSKNLEVKSKQQKSPSNELVGLRPEPNWVRRYREKATNHDESVKLLSTRQRLLPSATVTLVVLALSFLFAANYTPPSRSARIWPELPPAAATIFTIIGINCAVFMFWRVPPLWKFMNRNFLVAPVYPYSMSMLGAAFSHQEFSHLFANCACLWLLGTRLHDDVGRGNFLAVYFSCAVIGSFIPMAIYVLRKNLIANTLGASAAVLGVVATSCVLHEGTNIRFPFLPPEWTRGIDTGVLLGVLMMMELLALRRWGITPGLGPNAGSRPRVDNMGHLAGYCAGTGAGAVIRSTDPKWKNKDRHHVFTRKFGKVQEPVPPKRLPHE